MRKCGNAKKNDVYPTGFSHFRISAFHIFAFPHFRIFAFFFFSLDWNHQQGVEIPKEETEQCPLK